MGIIKKYIRKIVLLKNESSKFFYKGKIEIGEKTKFYQKLKLYNTGGYIKIGKECFLDMNLVVDLKKVKLKYKQEI